MTVAHNLAPKTLKLRRESQKPRPKLQTQSTQTRYKKPTQVRITLQKSVQNMQNNKKRMVTPMHQDPHIATSQVTKNPMITFFGANVANPSPKWTLAKTSQKLVEE